VPIAVQCPAGEVCKFRSLAAGGDHTCAVDTNGKAWCWGEEFTPATGPSSFGVLAKHTHRRITAANALGVPATFVGIDTNVAHTCAVSAAQDVYCWGANFSGELGVPMTIQSTSSAQLVPTGTRYKSVTVGMTHSCAVHANADLADCWGDNQDFQLTGNANSTRFITINSAVPLARGVRFMAAGGTTTCAQVANGDIACWGKPSHGAPLSSASQGFVALTAAYAQSMAADLDTCTGFRDCARICITDIAGEFFCGHWKAGTAPQQLLTKVPDPQGLIVISWTQVDVGPNHVCAVTTRQDVWCFGDNSWGQFGTGVFATPRTDKPVTAANR
jgi:alpha-tubulin suppressor-like RCC1 family protein